MFFSADNCRRLQGSLIIEEHQSSLYFIIQWRWIRSSVAKRKEFNERAKCEGKDCSRSLQGRKDDELCNCLRGFKRAALFNRQNKHIIYYKMRWKKCYFGKITRATLEKQLFFDRNFWIITSFFDFFGGKVV